MATYNGLRRGGGGGGGVQTGLQLSGEKEIFLLIGILRGEVAQRKMSSICFCKSMLMLFKGSQKQSCESLGSRPGDSSGWLLAG